MADGVELRTGLPSAHLVDWVLRLVHPHERGGAARREGRAPGDHLVGWVCVCAGLPGALDHRRGYESGCECDVELGLRATDGSGIPL